MVNGSTGDITFIVQKTLPTTMDYMHTSLCPKKMGIKEQEIMQNNIHTVWCGKMTVSEKFLFGRES